ncbi:MAG: poly(3-hydroxyalkanoate) synthetase [Pseudomonas sp.]|nr:poly(3-hydroxyalkanoate) synthetase [Pseudomonas sp.]
MAQAVKKKEKTKVKIKKPEIKQDNAPASLFKAKEEDKTDDQTASPFGVWSDLMEYQIDAFQRSVLFFDTLRQRADNMLEHEKAGMPPLLDFKYEMVLDARKFERPANYALLKITEAGEDCLEDCLDPDKPPVMIVDPRAGHGPGIGGFKRDSEVGIALHEGHPVYFVIFYPNPEPDQTMGDVLAALRKFVEEVSAWHDNKPPVLYGNCQAGWMLALLSADCSGLVGPAVMNGSPLSYWAGGEEMNPMQVRGGLSGGVWLTRMMSDMSNGIFDGAWLVHNFEQLNPAKAIWDKYYNLFANVDKESERFLSFERWWNGFYSLSEEEITATVENLFIGNKIERGEMVLDEHCAIDLKDIKNPLLIFASEGDEITPPRQALHWIRAVYPDTKALKKAGQRIVYLINPHVGHLGIFVSAKVAKLEHRAILENTADIESLKPGLYEMIIDNPTGDPDCSRDQYEVRFEERLVEDICESVPQDSFEAVRSVSEKNDDRYKQFARPFVEAFANPLTAEVLKTAHPMRASRKIFSEQLNPAMLPLPLAAQTVRDNRKAAAEDNPFKEMERQMAERIEATIETMSDYHKKWQNAVFKAIYG